MKKFLLIAFLLISSQEAFAAVGAPCGDYGECDSFKPELNNMESLQLGALTYINHCYGCHSLKYSRWGRIAKDLDIPEDIFNDNLVFGANVKLGDRMTGSMKPAVSETWFGIAPPDLTLVTRLHGSDWVYTYLRTFYEDSSKPYGVNNMVYPGAAMPNVLASMQGQQILSCKDVPLIASNGGVRRDEMGNDITEEKCGYLKTVEGSGALSVQEFDEVIFNLVNFMTYVGEPSRSDRERMGWYAILFFIVFTALAYLLFREYEKRLPLEFNQKQRGSMILYSDKDDHYSHRVRIVLAEKDIACEIRETSNEEAPEEVLALNPYHTLPILADRDLGLYDAGVMLEYLDERFPHPPLLPVYPVSRANSRTLMLRIDKEWCPLVDTLIAKELSEKELLIVREELLNEISTVAPTFKEFDFFMSEDFSLIDCYLAPILWRLPSLGINLPLNRHLKPLLDYQAKIFARPSFQDSLSLIERDLRD